MSNDITPSELDAVQDAVEAIENAVEAIQDAIESDESSLPPTTTVDTVENEGLRRNLESDLKAVLDGIVKGDIVIPDGKKATPHVIAGLIQERRGGAKADRPSAGAVAAGLNRWRNIGFITLTEGPTAFEDYTDAARNEGLSALKKANRQRLSAARAAQKAAQTPPPAVQPEPVAQTEQVVTQVVTEADVPVVPFVADPVEAPVTYGADAPF
jgi:hypothetical protein